MAAFLSYLQSFRIKNIMSNEIIVCKFGGTSVADAKQIRKVAAIIESNPRRKILVVSAPGKRFSDDLKVTDLLLTCWHLAGHKLDYSQPLQLVSNRYHEIADDLNVDRLEVPLQEMRDELEKLSKGEKSLATRDWMAARGEYLHAFLIARFLGATFVGAGECIFFGDEDKLDPRTYDILAERVSGEGIFVVPGFYGRDKHGEIKTFPRGGSDITGAVVARAAKASLYENWSDVSGLLMTDPRIVDNPNPISEVTYRELRELSYSGANVFQEEAIFPAAQAGIPIVIKNTNAPQDPGTRIVAKRDASKSTVVGIAGRTGFTSVTLEKEMMNQQYGFVRRVLEIFETHQISFEHMPTAIDSLSVIAAHESMEPHLDAILEEIQRSFQPERLDVTYGLALIATVGEGMAYRVGIAARLFDALSKAEVNVRMITQGSSEINIIVAVDGKDYETALRAIYDEFADA
jgi:aspartate kinase